MQALWAIPAFLAGAVLALAIVFEDDVLLSGRQWHYKECVRLGAPPENCLAEYLLPKDKGHD